MKAYELPPNTDLPKELDEDLVVLTRNHQPVALVVPIRFLDRESLALSTNPEFQALLERARQEFQEGRTLSLDAMKKAVTS